MTREELLAKLRAQRFDALIVGGGIVGAGIARDAAMRGLRVALIEQGDFASGTSSKTSKLIHGGLRYLEHGALRLVFESLRERQTLRTIAPSMVHPLRLLLPVYEGDGRPAWKINAGLWLYDLLALGRHVQAHRMVSARRALAMERGLRVDGLRAAGLFADCQMDDARLCLANVLQAVSFGAVCCNYVRLRAFLKTDGGLCGGMVEDALTGREIEVHARAVINAAGPWADRVRTMSDANAERRITPTKGSHLILPRLTSQALFVPAHAEGRMLFVLPWGGYSLVGTTESPVGNSLDTLSASGEEVEYLLGEVNRALPGRSVGEEDIVATYAGARPLLAFSGAATSASREHRIEVDARGLISVLGGKYTTYRLIAKQTVDLLAGRVGRGTERCLTDRISLQESVHPVTLDRWLEVTRSMDPELLTRLLGRYGSAVCDILEMLVRDPGLSRPVCPHHESIEAEVAHAFRGELACTVTDALARRTRVAWSSCQGLDCLSMVVELVQRYGGAAEGVVERQVEGYRQFLARGLAFRPARDASMAWADGSARSPSAKGTDGVRNANGRPSRRPSPVSKPDAASR